MLKLPPVQVMLFGHRFETDMDTVEAFENDRRLYGNFYMRVTLQGKIERIDPRTASFTKTAADEIGGPR